MKDYLNEKRPGLFSAAMLAWLVSLPIAAAQLALLKQIVFHQSRAIWLDKGQLFFVDPAKIIGFRTSVIT